MRDSLVLARNLYYKNDFPRALSLYPEILAADPSLSPLLNDELFHMFDSVRSAAKKPVALVNRDRYEKVRLSVILAAGDDPDLIRRFIEAYPVEAGTPYEIIIVDYSHSYSFYESLPLIHEKFINYSIYSGETYNAAEAYEVGLNAAKGRYVMFVEPGLEFLNKDAVALLFNIISTNEYAMCSAPVYDDPLNLDIFKSQLIFADETFSLETLAQTYIAVYEKIFILNNKLKFLPGVNNPLKYFFARAAYVLGTWRNINYPLVRADAAPDVSLDPVFGRDYMRLVKIFDDYLDDLIFLKNGVDNETDYARLFGGLLEKYIIRGAESVKPDLFTHFYYFFAQLSVFFVLSPALRAVFNELNLADLYAALETKNNKGIYVWIKSLFDAARIREFYEASLNVNVQYKKECCVAIPAYTPSPDLNERESLKKCCLELGAYDLYLVCPYNLQTSEYEKIARDAGVNLNIAKFPDLYFRSYEGYSLLCIDPVFYKYFSSYKFTLLHQLDAWVFSNRLAEFCALPYDYIGCPWKGVMKFLTKISELKNNTGIGGFTLRNNGRMIESLFKMFILWLTKTNDPMLAFPPCNEDILICKNLPRAQSDFKIAPIDTGIDFCVGHRPELLIGHNKKMPFGAHAYIKFGKHFWKKFIPIY